MTETVTATLTATWAVHGSRRRTPGTIRQGPARADLGCGGRSWRSSFVRRAAVTVSRTAYVHRGLTLRAGDLACLSVPVFAVD
jgi:hypothetical protein